MKILPKSAYYRFFNFFSKKLTQYHKAWAVTNPDMKYHSTLYLTEKRTLNIMYYTETYDKTEFTL